MFQDLVPLTAGCAETTNGEASARKLLTARPAESRVEIEASRYLGVVDGPTCSIVAKLRRNINYSNMVGYLS